MRNVIKHIISASFLTALLSIANAAETAKSTVAKADSLDALLKIVKQADGKESRENQQRIQRFVNERNRQQELLNQAKAELEREEKRSDDLKNQFDTNEGALAEMNNQLKIKLGNLGEAVGVVRQISAESASRIKESIVSSQLKERHVFLGSLAQAKEIPQIPELRRLWVELQTEMTEQGKIEKFEADILNKKGQPTKKVISRIGTFNLVAEGEFLMFKPESGNVEELSRQPNNGDFAGLLSDYESSSSFGLVALDPSRGTIVDRERDRDTWPERVENYAGAVGFAIIGVMIIGLIIAIERVLTLSATGSKMRKQVNDATPGNNPLGRVMSVYMANKDDSIENLELKLDEAVLKELPKLEARISIIKIFAAVSPLMGLLGTVTGMIETFQGITLYGSGDPGVMAQGISQALMTTVLGIVAAIPLILIHAMVSGKSKGLVHVLEEQSAGLIAQHTEGK